MVYVPSARKYGFALRLNESVMSDVLNSSQMGEVIQSVASDAKSQIENHVRATSDHPKNAENYVSALFMEDAFTDEYGYDFDSEYGLGNRRMAVIGLRPKGTVEHAKTPLMVEAETHALSAVNGSALSTGGEDVR